MQDYQQFAMHLEWLKTIYTYVRLFSDLRYLSFFWEFSDRMSFLNSYSEDFSYLMEDKALAETLEVGYWEKNCSQFHSREFYSSLVAFKDVLLQYDRHWEENINKGDDYHVENTIQVINDPVFLKVVNFCKAFLPVFEEELANKLHQSLPPIIFSTLNRVYFSVDEIDYDQLNNDLDVARLAKK